MGPVDNTPEWDEQVESIVTAIGTSSLEGKDLDQSLMLWIMDESYSRSAILTARKKLMTESAQFLTG